MRSKPVQKSTGDQALDEAIAKAQAGSLERYVEDRRRKRASYARCPVEQRNPEWEQREEQKDATVLHFLLWTVRNRVIERFRNGSA